MSLLDFFSTKLSEHKGSGTNIQFRNHNPESRVLFVYNTLNKGLYDLSVVIIDNAKNEFRVAIEKIPVRSTCEIYLDELVDKNGNPVSYPLATISVLYKERLDSFRIIDDGKIFRT